MSKHYDLPHLVFTATVQVNYCYPYFNTIKSET